ncbi:MAG: carboxypeptidase regulatory-like domain-containing protein [Candidatus Acidiferrum sp.]
MKRQARFVWVVVFSFVVALCGNSARGQAVYGSIIGTVTDPQGSAVAGAKVTVTSITKDTSTDTTTNESGNFAVTHLIPDTYKVRVEGAGFKAYEIATVPVSADTASSVDAHLEVGSVTQSIEVTGEIPQLKTDRADVAIEFNERYVEDLPVLNRNFTNFELLSPGTQKLVGWSHAATENPQGGGQIFVDGQHFSGTGFELDGTDNQDPILGIIVINPNLEAVTETKMTLQNMDAESGKAVAGLVTVQTKSGSNDLHGSGFFYYRGSGQEARDPFTNKPGVALPNATWKQFGASISGPIIKDKLFFFGDYQGTRQIAGITNSLTIPSAEVLSTCNPATNGASDTPGFCNLGQYLSVYNQGGQVYDPTSSAALDGSGRTAFNKNLIPIGMISPQAAAVLAAFPQPQNGNLVTPNYFASGSGPFNQNAFDTRIDYVAPHGYDVFGRYSLNYFTLSGKGSLGSLGAVGFGPGGLNGASTVHNQSLAAGFTKSLNPHLLTDVRFGYFKYNPQTNYSDAGSNPMTAFGIPGLNLGTPSTTGLASFFLQQGGNNDAFSPFGDGLNVGRCNCPLTESEQQFQFVNNWTVIKGNHQIKFGADIRYAMNLRVPSDANRTGILNFDAGGTSNGGAGGLSLATFLLGDVTSFQRFVSTSLTAAERQKRWFFYGQDSWRITSKLTFNYGLRWEIYFPESVNGKGNGGFADFSGGVIKVAGYGPVGLNGNVANTYKAFGPRLGIAYQADSKTVVRLGYGRSFDIGVFGSNFGHVVTQNLPVLANQTISDSNLPANQGGANVTNNRTAIFSLAQGPPQFDFSTILGAISPQGTLPLLGPAGNVQPRMRPNVQRLPTLDAWNASVQRQLTKTISLEVAYIGNKGSHVFAGTGPSYNNNEVRVGDGTNLVSCSVALVPPATCPTANVKLAGFAATIPNTLRRNYPQYPLDLTWFGNDASSNYNALQVKLEKRFSSGLQLLAHYTYSHANAFDSNYYSVDPRYAYGPDPFNRNHLLVINSVYELPFGRGRQYMSGVNRATDLLIGGWQVSNTLTWGGGLPWTPSIGECGTITDAGPCRPNVLNGGSGFNVGPKRINGVWYDFTPVASLAYSLSPALVGTDSCTLARPTSGPFALPACGTIGNARFDSYRGPHVFYDDMALSKNFTITERVKAQFRFDAYNVFNHPVLGFNSNQGNTCVDCSSGGQITDIEGDASPGSPNGMRQLQFGFKVSF